MRRCDIETSWQSAHVEQIYFTELISLAVSAGSVVQHWPEQSDDNKFPVEGNTGPQQRAVSRGWRLGFMKCNISSSVCKLLVHQQYFKARVGRAVTF